MINTRMLNRQNKSLLLPFANTQNKSLFVNPSDYRNSMARSLENTIKTSGQKRSSLSPETSRLNFSMSLLAKNLRSNKAFLGSILSYMRLGANSTSMLYKGHFINTSS